MSRQIEHGTALSQHSLNTRRGRASQRLPSFFHISPDRLCLTKVLTHDSIENRADHTFSQITPEQGRVMFGGDVEVPLQLIQG
jgi:hypothetical protein